MAKIITKNIFLACLLQFLLPSPQTLNENLLTPTPVKTTMLSPSHMGGESKYALYKQRSQNETHWFNLHSLTWYSDLKADTHHLKYISGQR